jgi:basic membrane protein A
MAATGTEHRPQISSCVDVAVFDVIKSVVDKSFTGGVHELGLAEHGVRFVADENNVPRLLPIEIVQRVKALGEDIVAGKIQVPAR